MNLGIILRNISLAFECFKSYSESRLHESLAHDEKLVFLKVKIRLCQKLLDMCGIGYVLLYLFVKSDTDSVLGVLVHVPKNSIHILCFL